MCGMCAMGPRLIACLSICEIVIYRYISRTVVLVARVTRVPAFRASAPRARLAAGEPDRGPGRGRECGEWGDPPAARRPRGAGTGVGLYTIHSLYRDRAVRLSERT